MRRELLLIEEMIDAAEQACSLVAGVPVDELNSDRRRRDALARLRNRVIHGYWSIDLGILHTTATDQLPPFIAQLRAALDTLAADD